MPSKTSSLDLKLYYCGKPGDGYGWAVCNTNLVRALGKYCEVVIDESSTRFDGPVFMPVNDHQLEPMRRVKAPRILGYCFTEWPIGDKARKNALFYDHLFCGSLWNKERLAAHGIKSEVLHQGIDFERFKPLPPSERQGFVVFSGGKFEYRKGQDYVVAAMRHFMAVRKDVFLLAAWYNPWPQSAASMASSNLLDNWEEPLADLPADRVRLLPAMPNAMTPEVYRQAHIGIFPNRCEAGTNLVMCEFMATGRAVIATHATGHCDALRDAGGAFLLEAGSYDPAGWFNPNASDIIAHLEAAYAARDDLPRRGLECRNAVERFSWDACAQKVVNAAWP